MTWLITQTGVFHTRRSLPELDTLSLTLSSPRKPQVIHYLLWPCWSSGKQALHSTALGKTFLAAAPRNSSFVFGKGLAGSESDCEDSGERWWVGVHYLVFPPHQANWRSSSRPAGGTVNQLQQRMLLFSLLSESRAVISNLEKCSFSARIKTPIMLFSFLAWLNT